MPEAKLHPQATSDQTLAVSVNHFERIGPDGGSCSGQASLVLNVPDARLGYRLEVVHGDLGFAFPKGFVQSVTPGILRFTWSWSSTGGAGGAAPVEAVVRITAMSLDGTLSKPLLLKIEDAGRSPAHK